MRTLIKYCPWSPVWCPLNKLGYNLHSDVIQVVGSSFEDTPPLIKEAALLQLQPGGIRGNMLDSLNQQYMNIG